MFRNIINTLVIIMLSLMCGMIEANANMWSDTTIALAVSDGDYKVSSPSPSADHASSLTVDELEDIIIQKKLEKMLFNTDRQKLLKYLYTYGYTLAYVEKMYGSLVDNSTLDNYFLFEKMVRGLHQEGKITEKEVADIFNAVQKGSNDYGDGSDAQSMYDTIISLLDDDYLLMERQWDVYLYALTSEIEELEAASKKNTPAPVSTHAPSSFNHDQVYNHILSAFKKHGFYQMLDYVNQFIYLSMFSYKVRNDGTSDPIYKEYMKILGEVTKEMAKIDGESVNQYVWALNFNVNSIAQDAMNMSEYEMTGVKNRVARDNPLGIPHDLIYKY